MLDIASVLLCSVLLKTCFKHERREVIDIEIADCFFIMSVKQLCVGSFCVSVNRFFLICCAVFIEYFLACT